MAAVKTCVDALSGKIASEQFREALLCAADEAGIARSFARPAGELESDDRICLKRAKVVRI